MLQVSVDDKQITDKVILEASLIKQKINVTFEAQPGAIYTYVLQMLHVSENQAKKLWLHISINVSEKNVNGTMLVNNAYVHPMPLETIKEEYRIWMYRQQRELDCTLEEFVKNEYPYWVNPDFYIAGARVVPVASLSFTVAKELAPGNLTPKMLRETPPQMIWKLIQDYKIDMKNTLFDDVARRLLEWQKE
jgi:hypothetical protein